MERAGRGALVDRGLDGTPWEHRTPENSPRRGYQNTLAEIPMRDARDEALFWEGAAAEARDQFGTRIKPAYEAGWQYQYGRMGVRDAPSPSSDCVEDNMTARHADGCHALRSGRRDPRGLRLRPRRDAEGLLGEPVGGAMGGPASQSAAQAGGRTGDAVAGVGDNFPAAASQRAGFWEGDGAEAYSTLLVSGAGDFAGYKERCGALVETRLALRDLTTSAVELLYEILGRLGDWATWLALEAAIPIVGCVAEPSSGISTATAVCKLNRGIQAINQIVGSSSAPRP